MNNIRNLFVILLLALFSAAAAPTQEIAHPTKHFDKDGVAFDYPADWTLTENNSPGLQTVMVAPGSLPTQIVVSRFRSPACEVEQESRNIENTLVMGLLSIIKANANHGSKVTAKIGGSELKGTEFRGLIDRQPALGVVYSQHLTGQFISLAFIRRVDDSTATSAWNIVRQSLKIEPLVLGTKTASPRTPGAPVAGGVMNGKAVSLPRPDYPAIARSAHASGMVVVQVTIDEAGAVIAAQAVSGHPLLQSASVAAARQAKFSPPKLCGEPVRVTGVITYNFVAM
jgi:TonB family protein